MKKRMVGLFLCLAMFLSLLPASVLTAGASEQAAGSDLYPQLPWMSGAGFSETVTENSDGSVTITCDNTQGTKMLYGNFWKGDSSLIEAGVTYSHHFTVTDVQISKTDTATNEPTLSFSYTEGLGWTLAGLQGTRSAVLKDGQDLSGWSYVIAGEADGSNATGSLRSYLAIPVGYSVTCTVKITLTAYSPDNLYLPVLSSRGDFTSVNAEGKVCIAGENTGTSTKYSNFFTAVSPAVEEGRGYRVSYTVKADSVSGTPYLYISSPGNQVSSQLGDTYVYVKLTEAGTFTGSYDVIGRAAEDCNFLLRSYAMLHAGDALDCTVEIEITELSQYAVTKEAANGAQIEGHDTAPGGVEVSYTVTLPEGSNTVAVQVLDQEGNALAYSYDQDTGALRFTMPYGPVTIRVSPYALSCVSDGQSILPQTVEGANYLFLPASADWKSLALSGNVYLKGTGAAATDAVIDTASGTACDLRVLYGEELRSGTAYLLGIYADESCQELLDTVYVMKADSIATIYIELSDGATVEDLNQNGKPSYSGTITMADGEDGELLLDNAKLKKIKGRGNSSWASSGDKRPYNINLDSSVELIEGAGKSKKWCLISDNCYGNWIFEGAGLANIMAYDMYASLNGAYHFGFRSVNLYINGEYRGVYLLTEKIEIDDKRIDVTSSDYAVEDEDNTTLILQEGGLTEKATQPRYWGYVNLANAVTAQAEDPAIAAGIQAYQYATGSELEGASGGFLLELDRNFYGEASWFITRRGYAYVLKEPEFATMEQVRQVAVYVQEMEDAVFSDTGYNALGNYYTDYLDLDALARKLLVDLASGQTDTFITSCYFSIDVDDSGIINTKLLAGPAWDYDGSNYGSSGMGLASSAVADGGWCETKYMVSQLLKHAELAEQMRLVSTEELQSLWQELIDTKLPAYMAALEASQAMNSVLWGQSNNGSAVNAANFEAFAAKFAARYDLWYGTFFAQSRLQSVILTEEDGLLTAQVQGGGELSYEWLLLSQDKQSFTPIEGATGSTYRPESYGTYAVYVTGLTAYGQKVAGFYSNSVTAGAYHYTYSAEGNVITATCLEDPTFLETATLLAPQDGVYTGSTYTATVLYSENFPRQDLTVTYEKDGVSCSQAIDAGSYTASVTVADAVAQVSFTVSKAPTQVGIAPEPAVLTGGGEVLLQVDRTMLPPEAELTISCDDSTIALTRTQDGYLAQLPNADGTYRFTVSYAGSDNYEACQASCQVQVRRQEETVIDNPFEDILPTDYYYDPVLWAVGRNITTGTSQTSFSPADPCTRAQMVTFLWRAAGCPEAQLGENPFADVTEDAYYYEAVLWAVEQGITTGTSQTTFSPDATCTRGQTVTFLYRFAEGSPASGQEGFADVRADAYYYDAVLWAVENGITNGTGNGRFSPEDNCTRGQIVTFLYRCFE